MDKILSVPADVREGLLIHYVNARAAFTALKPGFSQATFYRAISGQSVSEEVCDFLKSRWLRLSYRALTDDEVTVALEAAQSAVRALTGKRIHIDDLRDEIVKYNEAMRRHEAA